ncbi:LAME_0C02718g1_1 [Lachancea meyersii CBS 8951]|uniref:LAME_0C02718g1_1 n=1 Tax=Lachancea meyersii CBS 8951 TaxID=1266667 RepID=A0A1G4IZY8_9SACH|nr:LAME_0C02718g1_1 [Lachancea meyersii CBS 8951]
MIRSLCFVLGLSVLNLCWSFEQASRYDPDDQDEFPFTTVVDILWQNVEFSTFLRKIQKSGNINYLNELDNFTFVAPINSAFSNHSEAVKIDHYLLHNYVLNPASWDTGIHVLVTNDSTPHLLQLKSNGAMFLNEAPILKEVQQPNMQNATMYSTTSLLSRAQDLVEVIESNPHASFFFKLVSHLKDERLLNLFDRRTVLVPNNAAFEKQFNSLELEYLLGSENHENDLPLPGNLSENRLADRRLLIEKVLVDGLFGGHFEQVEVLNLKGDSLVLNSHANGSDISVNDSLATTSNLIYKPGIAHMFSDLNFLSRGFHFTAEKYLIGLGAVRFVEEVHMRKLTHLINGSFTQALTIFVPIDTNYDSPGYSKSSLLYHFVDTEIVLTDGPSGENSHKLYDSMFCSSNKRLGGKCQRLKIESRNQGNRRGFFVNKKYRVVNSAPFMIGNTAIYLMEHEVMLPGDLLSAMDPFSGCSKSMEFLRELNLLDLRPNNRGFTALLPCFKSWSNFDLNLEYLEHNISALNLIMKNYILNDLIYTDTDDMSFVTSNLYDEPIAARLHDVESDSNSVLLNLSSMNEPIQLKTNFDTFFDQGVIHPISDVYYPKALDISLQNLLETTQSYDFVAYLKNFDSLKGIFDNSNEYSILVPTARSLLLEDIGLNSTRLEEFLGLHIIFSNSTQSLLKCENSIKTLNGKSLNCRESSSNAQLLRVVDGADKEVRILKKGCSSSDENSCIFLLDRPISLSWLEKEGYKIRLPGTALAMGALLGILFIFGLLSCALMTFVRKPTPNNNEPEQGAADQERLLSSSNVKQRNGYSSIPRGDAPGRRTERLDGTSVRNHEPGSFANLYSVNTSREPLSIDAGANQNQNYS